MKEITFEINSNEELWSLIDQDFNHILIHKFMPNEAIEWWKTTIKLKNNDTYENLQVRNMQFDILTDLKGLKRVLDLNTLHLSIYQFNKPIANTLAIEYLPAQNLEKILLQNGLMHQYNCDYEFLTISSSSEKFIKDIENNPLFKQRIAERKSN